MPETNDSREEPPVAAALDGDDDDDAALAKSPVVVNLVWLKKKKNIRDLPKELLVSVFAAVGDHNWVRRTFPLVRKEWAELYRTRDASPLHGTLEVDFRNELERARAEAHALRWRAPLRNHAFHASRVIAWAERRAGSVQKLHLDGVFDGALEDFTSEDLRTLVAAVRSSLEEIRVDSGTYEQCRQRFWESLRDSVAPAGRLRSLVVEGCFAVASESDVEPLGQHLAGGLEELVLVTKYWDPDSSKGGQSGLPRFPESICALTELRRLNLEGHFRITAIPAKISSLKRLETIQLRYCRLFSLPKELGELPGLTKLDLSFNRSLGNAPPSESIPAALGKLKSLRVLNLRCCGLRSLPAFIGELRSLEMLDLSFNDFQIDDTIDVLIKGCPLLREIGLYKGLRTVPWAPESRAHLEVFKAKLHVENPKVKVLHDYD
jgi:hypothetical protein